jgi:hypothetical protein
MITLSKMDVANMGLFILSHVFIPLKHSITLMPFCGPLSNWFDYLNIVKYKYTFPCLAPMETLQG